MLEREIEDYFAEKAITEGGRSFKFICPGNAGVPDRVLIIYQCVYFVELKAPGEHPRPLQDYVFDQILEAGGIVVCLDSKNDVDQFYEEIKAPNAQELFRFHRNGTFKQSRLRREEMKKHMEEINKPGYKRPKVGK